MRLTRRQFVRILTGAAVLGLASACDAGPAFEIRPKLTPGSEPFECEPYLQTEASYTARQAAAYSTFYAQHGYTMPTAFLLEGADANATRFDLPRAWYPPVPSQGRLRQQYRQLSAAVNVHDCLAASALYFVKSGRASPQPGPGAPGLAVGAADDAAARAFADLAVTGRRAWAKFREAVPTNASVLQTLDTGLRAFPVDANQFAPEQLALAVELALTRANQVAFAIRSGVVHRNLTARHDLGYIAATEDDTPHRPLNVPAAPYQFDLDLGTMLGTIQIRCCAWWPGQSVAVDWPPTDDELASWASTGFRDEHLSIPTDMDVVLYVHGHSSRGEEAAPLADNLLTAGAERGKNLVVISFDLPGCGYSSHLEPEQLSLRGAAPTLDFYQTIIGDVVDALDLRGRLLAIVGGSLGGNLALRLAQKPFRAARSLSCPIVSWDPGSIWVSFLKTVEGEVVLGHTKGRPMEPETENSRRDYFNKVFDFDGVGPFGVVQAEAWYRDSWGCKQRFISESILERYEIYDAAFRRWHWQVAYDQLVYSQQENGAYSTSPSASYDALHPYRTLSGPLLLLNGELDTGGRIGENTKRVAQLIHDERLSISGAYQELQNTGHSIQAERPYTLAKLVLDFAYGSRS